MLEKRSNSIKASIQRRIHPDTPTHSYLLLKTHIRKRIYSTLSTRNMFQHWSSESSTSTRAKQSRATPYFATLPIETPDERYIRLWQEFVTAFMKMCDIHELIHITDDNYTAFTMASGNGPILQFVPPEKLRKRFTKQKGKTIQVKTGVHQMVGPHFNTANLYTGVAKPLAYMVN